MVDTKCVGVSGAENAGGHREVRFLELFSGIGGVRLGFEQACRDAGVSAECVGAAEIDKHAVALYRRHWPDTPQFGDITALASSGAIPDFDVALAGFCCQSFSKAGLKLGFEDARGTLFFWLASILKTKKPAAFLFENVEHLIHHDGGRTLKRILEILKQLGYRVSWQILISRHFGTPQNRARIFLVGFREGGEGFQFPEPTDSSKTLADILETSPVDPIYYLSEQNLAGAKERKRRNVAAGKGFGYRIIQPDGVANTLVCGGSGLEGNLVVDDRIAEFPVLPRRKTPLNRECLRHLTPLECERLQGFPPDWTAGQADSHRYHQLANAVTVPVVQAISRNLLDALSRGPLGVPATVTSTPVTSTQITTADVEKAGQNGQANAPVAQVLPAAIVPQARSFKFVDLFSGLGGFRLAAEAVGGHCVFSCDIDRSAREVYHANHGEWPSGDITKIKAGDVPDHDVLCGGFPCQPFSVAGNATPERYAELRDEFNASGDAYRRACLFVYLNRHCFNGLTRYSTDGRFTTAFGGAVPRRLPEAEMRAFADQLGEGRAIFTDADFRLTMAGAQAGDFVYCDPPYIPVGKAGFTAYTRDGFGLRDHEELAECCRAASLCGATVVVSNHDCGATRQLYRDADEIVPLQVRRMISCDGTTRGDVDELLAVWRPR